MLEKLLYSRKFLALTLFILYVTMAYITADFTFTSIAYGTLVVVIVLSYLAYYAKAHYSGREALALTLFTILSMILGTLTGNAIIGFENIGSIMYATTLTIASFLLILALGKLYKIRTS